MIFWTGYRSAIGNSPAPAFAAGDIEKRNRQNNSLGEPGGAGSLKQLWICEKETEYDR